jgi:hypothetical protein
MQNVAKKGMEKVQNAANADRKRKGDMKPPSAHSRVA